MSLVSDFAAELSQKSSRLYGQWFKIDLHNHSPASFDYHFKLPDVLDRFVEQIKASEVDLLMVTDHERLPDPTFTAEIAKRTGSVILRGVELNVFVDALGKPENKVSREFFYHLLVGFDPEGRHSPDYWLEEIYRKCSAEERTVGQSTIRGINASPEALADTLADANAILIPAHLHTSHDPSTSRSVDDIYDDPVFLRHARSCFTALEVVSATTAQYFDGQHHETEYLHKSCIRSSDSHEPGKIGWRTSFAQMEVPCYRELRAALELPFRISLIPPAVPASHVIGMHIRGAFFPDLWISFSPYCNVLMGVKGSGKTSVLECLRFALGAEVPLSRREAVASHLNAILGPAGTVRVLLRRADGATILVERSLSNRDFVITFPDDRQEHLSAPHGLLFPVQILGWHEIEQAATDINVRRVYMDTIAGRSTVRTLEEEATAIASKIGDRHAYAAQRYTVYRDLDRQAMRLQELRKGLQQLTDSNLIELRDRYQTAVDQREALHRTIEHLRKAQGQATLHVNQLLLGQERQLSIGQSPLELQMRSAQAILDRLVAAVNDTAHDIASMLEHETVALEEQKTAVDTAFQTFLLDYSKETEGLTAEQRRLLETHREVLEQTKGLASIEAEREQVRAEVTRLLQELTQLCDDLAGRLDERSQLRAQRVGELSQTLANVGVRLSVRPQQQSSEFQEMSNRYATGARAVNELKSKLPERLSHLVFRKAYGGLLSDLRFEYGSLLFDSAEVGHFLTIFENDDLFIELNVGKAGQAYSPIDQLSAGQRCTAIFPILLKLEEGGLIIDQPEDNLDNRHIATSIAPTLLHDKGKRQMVFTSHNANLVVLSDAECIALFESDGAHGRIEAQGFFATKHSAIAKHVMDVLDGGDKALELRAHKYGLIKPQVH